MNPRLMEPGDEPHVLTMAAAALNVPMERLAIRGRVRVPVWLPRVADGFPSAMTEEDKGKLARVGIGVTTGGVWLNVEALTAVAKLALGHRADTSLGATPVGVGEAAPLSTGLQHVPVVVLGPDDAQAVLALRVYRRMGERLPLTVQRLASEGSTRPRTALEETRDREEQQALAMIRDRRRAGESEPDTLKRLLVDIDEWPTVRRLLRETSLSGEGLAETAHRLTLGPAFQPVLDASTPEIVQRCAGLPMFQAAAQLAHYIRFEVPKLKGPGAPSAPQAEWMRAFCMRHHPAYQGDLIDWVMATLRKLAEERENLQALATLREGCATAWGKAVDLLAPLAEELDDNLGHEGPLDVLHRVLAQRAEAEEHDLEAVPRIDVTSPMEQVVVDKTSPPITLETPRDVVRFLNRRLGLDFDTCEDVAAYIEHLLKESWAHRLRMAAISNADAPTTTRLFAVWEAAKRVLDARGLGGVDGSPIYNALDALADAVTADGIPSGLATPKGAAAVGGERTWRGMPGESGTHRLFHDDTGALCYDGPGVKLLPNNRAHPYPGERSILFSDSALALIASIVNIARDAERVLQKQERAGIERELHNLKSPFLPVGSSASNPFLASLAGKTMNEAVTALACRALDTDAAAGALAQLFPGTPVSFAGLADVASAAVKDLRAKREETEGALGRIAALLSVERQAPVAIIEREVGLVRDAAHDRIEAVAEAARLRKVKRAAEVYFRAERAPSSARLDASAPRRALLDLLDPAAICWKAETGPGGGAGGVVLVSAKEISGVTISASGGRGGNATSGDAPPPATTGDTGSTDAKPAP